MENGRWTGVSRKGRKKEVIDKWHRRRRRGKKGEGEKVGGSGKGGGEGR